MMLRIFLFLYLFSNICFAQLDAKVSIVPVELEDYWVEELSPLTDLNEIVTYIHHDPYNFIFVDFIPGGNPLAREISVNSFYGVRSHPIHKVVKFHRGVDLQGIQGEQVIASGHGKVIDAGFREDLGNFIKIQHKYGFESIYGHLSKISVKKGQEVLKGQNIGKVGATGKVTGPHLHYTLKKNQEYLDPFDFLFMTFEKAF
ncbi:M23 family metallopeptidase [Lacihabitans sp. LS3-19]|uniref:M23 family metallopeptidase n=1 Tax=Lacihabitans sp. LS3-19 TaxID=2487335 RepID=UPI00286DD4CA|nr:M23 family metallopeptidase [Lacihabitans sp. LS3-19]MCP9770332.1 M23 family metallopeptidase [Lacihabitans sp. LS3-19]